MRGEPLKCRSLAITQGFSVPKERIHAPIHDVAPSAVTIAVDFDLDLFYTTGCDTQLERALQYIENGN